MRVKVEGESESSTRINLKSGNKQMIIDEPSHMGGTDMGPTPVQALLFALAGCLNVTGNFVAKEMGLPLEKMKIIIEGSLNPYLWEYQKKIEQDLLVLTLQFFIFS